MIMQSNLYVCKVKDVRKYLFVGEVSAAGAESTGEKGEEWVTASGLVASADAAFNQSHRHSLTDVLVRECEDAAGCCPASGSPHRPLRLTF